MGKYDIFISYSRNDTILATQIYEDFKRKGLKCYLDREEYQLDHNFADTIQSAIISSKYFIFIYGNNSENSILQRRELDLAIAHNKKVISILLNSSYNGIIPTILQNKTDCIDYRRNRYQSIEDILEQIKAKIFVETKCYSIDRNEQTSGYMVASPRSCLFKIIFFFIIILLPAYFLLTNISSSPDISNSSKCKELQRQDEELRRQIAKEGAIAEPPQKLMEKNEGHSASIDDEVFTLDDFDIDTTTKNDGENPEPVEQENIWNNGIIILSFGITLSIGIILGMIIFKLAQKITRKNNIKISSDVDVSISIDNVHKANIKAGEMYLTHLSKGEYIIDLISNDGKVENNRIIQKVTDNNTHVVLSEFLNKRDIHFKCFIAGSIALSAERDALRSVMAEMYNQWEADRIRICSYTFEDFNREVVVGGQQILYDKFIEKNADWVVFIISNGIGEKTLNEYHIAMKSFLNHGHPKILFLANSDASDDITVSNIKNEIIETSQYWNTFNNIEHMKSLFYKCVNWDVTLLSKTKK